LRSALASKPVQHVPEELLVQDGWATLVGIGEGRAFRRFIDAEMAELAQAAGEPVADLAQGVGTGEVTEEHRNQLGPAGEALGAPLGIVLADECSKLESRTVSQQLTEETCAS
jgi:hypothetical protein